MGKEEEGQRLHAVNDTARHVINDLRETIWALKKEHIQADELADKIKLLVQSQKGLQPQLETNITEKIVVNTRFSPTEALNVFRICQEAVMNCLRHAMAQKLCITIACNADDVFLITIADNGRGFVKQTDYCGHYGLENMEHRARELDATLTINTTPGQGTVVTLQKAATK
jgi:signal transduction histidine kinase